MNRTDLSVQVGKTGIQVGSRSVRHNSVEGSNEEEEVVDPPNPTINFTNTDGVVIGPTSSPPNKLAPPTSDR